jgi:hypothetical protein
MISIFVGFFGIGPAMAKNDTLILHMTHAWPEGNVMAPESRAYR